MYQNTSGAMCVNAEDFVLSFDEVLDELRRKSCKLNHIISAQSMVGISRQLSRPTMMEASLHVG